MLFIEKEIRLHIKNFLLYLNILSAHLLEVEYIVRLESRRKKAPKCCLIIESLHKCFMVFHVLLGFPTPSVASIVQPTCTSNCTSCICWHLPSAAQETKGVGVGETKYFLRGSSCPDSLWALLQEVAKSFHK